MRLPVALAFTLAAGALAGCPSKKPAGPGGGDSITLPLAQRTVGIAWTKVDDLTMALDLVQGEETLQLSSQRHHRTDSKILEVDAAGLVTKVQVSYPERVDTEMAPGEPAEKASAIRGNAYIVWTKDGVIGATTAAGAPVSAEELAELQSDQDDLGKPPVIEEIMARTWKVGEKVELTAAELGRINESEEGGGLQTAASFTLTTVEGGQATFAMTMTISNQAPPFTIQASGNAVVDVRTGRPARLEISGPIEGGADGLTIRGTMKALATYEFAQP